MGEGMVGLGDGCGVDEGMVGLEDGCGVDGEGSRVGTTRRVATGRQEGHSAGAVLLLGPSVVLRPHRSSCLLIWGLRDGRLYTVKEVHCR